MKLSFSIPSSKSSKSTPKPLNPLRDDESSSASTSRRQEAKHYVTEFDPSKTLPGSSNPTRVIAPLPNDYRPGKRMKNLSLPLQPDDDSSDLRFEVQTLSSDPAAGDSNMSFGLNLRQQQTEPEEPNSKKVEDLLLDKLRRDLKELPDDPDLEDFQEVPVEGFGAALLGGYGWKEGQGIGRNAKEDVKVVQIHRRTDRQGLGFVDGTEGKRGKDSNNSNRGNVDRDRNGSRGSGGIDANSGRDRDNDYGDGIVVDEHVRVIAGRGDVFGMRGVITERPDRESVVLTLVRTEKVVRVPVSHIAKLGSREEEQCLKRLKELKIKEKNGKRAVDQNGGGRLRDSRESSSRHNGGVERDRGVAWLKNHIRVRIVSKDLKGGKLYLKKGEVVDVVSPYVCDITMDENGELVQGVDQELLETALPRRGGPVLVLYGKHKGAYGNLVERDLDRETGVVRDSDTQELLNVKLEQIAEYIGDPSYVGY